MEFGIALTTAADSWKGRKARRSARLLACPVLRHPLAQCRAVRGNGSRGGADAPDPASHRLRPVAPAFQPLAEAYQKIYRSYDPAAARYLVNHRGHLMFLRPEEVALCTAELIKAATFTGTRAELRERLQGLRDAGCADVSVQIRHGHPQMLEEWADLFAAV